MKELKAMKAVYTYYFPEVRKLMKEVANKIPDKLFSVNAKAEDIQKKLGKLFNPALEIPGTEKGLVDLDEIHVPIIKRIIKAYSKTIKGLNYAFTYPTSGSSEGIFHILTQLLVKGVKEINTLKGEYEGYSIQAQNLGIKTNTFTEEEALNAKPGTWFISNPSARNGNIISNEFINELASKGNKIILDLAYVGTTKPYVYDVTDRNITQVVMSFSKPYGLFRFRVGGFVFSRNEIPTLYGNKWFKDVTRLLQALKVAEEIGPLKLYKKYKLVQEKIINYINKEFNLGLKASDAFLIGYIPENEANKLSLEQLELIKNYKREDYRLCLTPYIELLERGGL